MYSDFAKEKFKEFQGSDYDYLIIGKKNSGTNKELYAFVPSPHGTWTTIDEAIVWLLKEKFVTLEFYDLYAESYQSAMIRFVTKTTDETSMLYS